MYKGRTSTKVCMDHHELLKESHQEYQIWTINDQKSSNSLGSNLYKLFDQAISIIDPKTRLLVIKASPAGHQKDVAIAGGNLKELVKLTTKEKGRAYAQSWSKLCYKLQDLPFPVVMALDGQIIGGGVELYLSADIRLATQRTSLYFKQLKVGLAQGFGGTNRLQELVGKGLAGHLLLMTKKLNSEEALKIHLIHEVVENASTLDKKIEKTIQHFRSLDPYALAIQKKMLYRPAEEELDLFTKLWMEKGHRKFLDTIR